jgi:cob(I)alamin adenosyltransferase
VITLGRTAEVAGPIVRYLNRLSDLLFAMARAVNARAGVEEPEWLGRDKR